MKTYALLAALLILTSTAVSQDIEALKANIIYLSSDELGGRGPGSEGARKASEHIAKEFRKVGLKPFKGESFFQPFEMPGQKTPERNVIGYIPAKNKTTRSIVFTAHYDGYGIRESAEGEDKIYNAAQDNAAGVAGLIELARIYAAKDSPSQNLVFIATAAEESGAREPVAELTGAEFYSRNPLFPISDVTINLNIDGFNNLGPAADFWVMPRQGVDIIDDILSATKASPMKYNPPEWIDGMNTSFDTRVFLARGIPAVTIWTGFTLRAGVKGDVPKFGRVHAPDDEYNDTWRFDGAAEHLRLYEAVADTFLASGKKAKVTDPDLFKPAKN